MSDPPVPASVLRDFPDRALRWLLESNDNVRGLLLTVAPDLAARIDCDRLAHVPRSFVQETLRAREADCVLRGPYRGSDRSTEREVWVYILLEHQSDPDPWMSFRLLTYMLALWESERREQEERRVPVGARRLSPILPIVFYTGRRAWQRLGSLADLVDAPAELHGYLPRHDSVFFSVNGSDPAALTASGDPLGWVLLLFRLEDAPVEELAAALGEIFSHLEAVARAGDRERWFRLAWIVVGFIRHRRPPEEMDRLLTAATGSMEDVSRGREVEVMARTSAEDLIEQGKAIGEARGRITAKRETLLRQMRLKFGPLPAELEATLGELADVARIDELLVRILTASTLDQMMA